jgi:NAD(P)H-nitrite reductase large subunit
MARPKDGNDFLRENVLWELIGLHHVIIGNGAAGISALQAIRTVDSESRITILSRERYTAYSPCSIPDLISGEMDEDMIFRFDSGFYDMHDAEFKKSSGVKSINPRRKTIKTESGETVKYDRLLIAAGSAPIIPPNLKGLDLEGVHVMGGLDSALKIRAHLEEGAKKAVIVGGGFMGSETAITLRKMGVKPIIVEMLPRILSRMLDPDISQKVETMLKAKGIDIVVGDSVTEIKGKKKVNGASLKKKRIKCDMVVLAIGVVPNVGLTKGSGIKTNLGILVDTTMKTNRKDIYAAGDIAEVREQILGSQGSFAIWPNAIEQGRVAGLNMAGAHTVYGGAELVNVLNVFETPVVAMGKVLNDVSNAKTVSKTTPSWHKKLILKDHKLLGLQFIGTMRNTGILYSLMKNGSDVSPIEERLLDDNLVLVPELATPSKADSTIKGR